MNLRTVVAITALLGLVVVLIVLLVTPGPSNGSRTQPSAAGQGFRAAWDEANGPNPAGQPLEGEGRAIDEAGDYIHGCVVREDGQPLAGAVVSWTCLIGDQTRSRPAVGGDENGCFRGRGCAGGIACATLHHPALEPAGPWTIQGRQQARWVARARPSVRGLVLALDGQPVGGATIRLIMREGDPAHAVLPWAPLLATSDADGIFTFFELAAPMCTPCRAAQGRCSQEDEVWRYEGPFGVEVAHDDYATAMIEVEALRDGLEIALKPAELAIWGRVLDPWGQSYPRAKVYLQAKERKREHRTASVDPTTGAFEITHVSPGPYQLVVVQDGQQLALLQEVTGLRPSEVAKAPKLQIQAAGPARKTTLRARIVDEKKRPWPRLRLSGPPFDGMTTDAQGWVVATDVAPGRYLVAPAAGGTTDSHLRLIAEVVAVDPTHASTSVPPNRTLTVELLLTRGITENH